MYHSAIRIPMKLANEIRRIKAEFRFSHFSSYLNGNKKLNPNFGFQFQYKLEIEQVKINFESLFLCFITQSIETGGGGG